MYQKRYAAATAVRDGRLYVIGGEIYYPDDGIIYTCSYCTYYNPEQDAWYNSPDLPSARLCSAACAMGGLLTTALPSPDPDNRAVGLFSPGGGVALKPKVGKRATNATRARPGGKFPIARPRCTAPRRPPS